MVTNFLLQPISVFDCPWSPLLHAVFGDVSKNSELSCLSKFQNAVGDFCLLTMLMVSIRKFQHSSLEVALEQPSLHFHFLDRPEEGDDGDRSISKVQFSHLWAVCHSVQEVLYKKRERRRSHPHCVLKPWVLQIQPACISRAIASYFYSPRGLALGKRLPLIFFLLLSSPTPISSC